MDTAIRRCRAFRLAHAMAPRSRVIRLAGVARNRPGMPGLRPARVQRGFDRDDFTVSAQCSGRKGVKSGMHWFRLMPAVPAVAPLTHVTNLRAGGYTDRLVTYGANARAVSCAQPAEADISD